MDLSKDAERVRTLAEEMQSDYKRLSSLAKRLASSIAGKGGAFIAPKLLEEVQQAVDYVQTDRRRVQQAAEVFHWESVPQDFAALSREAGRMEAEARAQAIADEAAPFLRLEAADDGVRAVLAEAQAALEKTLGLGRKLSSHGDAAASSAHLKEALRPYQTFVQALRTQSGMEKLSLLRALGEAFPDALIGALLEPGKLRLAEAESAAVAETAADAPAAGEADDAAEQKASASAEESAEDGAAVAEESAESEACAERQLWESFREKGLLLPEDYDYGELTMDISPKGKEKVGAKAFLSDFRRMTREVGHCARNILLALDDCNALDRAYIVATGKKEWTSETYDAAFERLGRLGCICTYTLAGCGTFYATTPKMRHLLTMEHVRSALELSKKAKHRPAAEAEPRASLAALRLALAKLHAHHAHALEDAQEEAFAAFLAETLGIVMMGAEDYKNGAHAVLFWFASEDEMEESPIQTKRHLERFLSHADALRDLTLAGMEKEPLTCLRKALCKAYPQIAELPVYYYLLPEDAFYDSAWEPAPDWFGKDALETTDDAEQAEEAEEAEEADESPDLPQTAQPSVIPVGKPLHLEDAVAVMDGAIAILGRGNLPAAAAYLGFCARVAPDAWDAPYRRLASAVDDPANPPRHRAGDLFALFSGCETVFDEYLAAAAALRTYFSNDMPHDYDMQRLQSGLLDESRLLDRCTPLKNLLYKLMEFKLEKQKGMDFYADYRRKDQKELERQLRLLQKEAQTIYDVRVAAPIKEHVHMRHFLATKQRLYDHKGDIAKSLSAVIEGSQEGAEEVALFVDTYLSDGSEGGARTVDAEKVGRYIDDVWDDTRISKEKRNDPLIGKLRNSLHGEIEKVADVLCRWADLKQGETAAVDDVDYQRARSGVLQDLRETEAGESARLADTTDAGERAGIEVLLLTLRELEERIDGSFQPSRTRYWYADFLRSTQLLLTDDYLPDYRAWHFGDAAACYLSDVQAYASADLPSFEARLDEIFSGQGAGSDDYQTARLIDEYLSVQSGTSYLAAHGCSIETNAPFAQNQARRLHDQFEEELEFAQSCGQIMSTGSDENKKESILALADDCYRYACETKNYGVFRRTTEAFRRQIAEDARKHGTELQGELDACRDGLLDEAHKEFLQKIQKMIDAQNYTVAEDMLRRWTDDDIDLSGVLFDEADDHLRRFLNPARYRDYYRSVSENGTPLPKLLGSSSYVPRNKKGRGAQELSKNWISNPMDGDRMKRLLAALGWDVDRAVLQGEGDGDAMSARGSKQIVFRVTLESSANHARSRYQHPIAIFGSEAERDGFRTVCLFGQYDADNLVATCSRLSATLPTIVFLDYALDLKQRRRLARKMKEAQLGKTYAVIDRVVMAYLFRNYDEIQVNRMLMMLIMPFAACQPYVPDSGQPMPPEMFMGRKEDLRAVEAADGVNIVYGGRQLGKSALLKMAQNDIDHDEAGDRAILVDLHDCASVGAAALAVSRELTDLHFFKGGQGVETEDWDTLARAIMQRLRDPVDHIPYFLLMLDEADRFIEQCAAVQYRPFDALKRVQQNGSAKFKFVIAGLHNIVRFSRGALGDNSVLAHLTHCTVKPFRVSEARELLETPLRYLGFRFSEESGSLISLILAHANYFPGLIQLYCKELIRTLSKENYAGYDENRTPPYEITRDHVRAVLTNHEFLEQVREKFMITLRLGGDNFYYIIAYLIASLYHKNGGGRGCTPDEIAQEAEEYEFEQFRTLPRERLKAFLDELTELNVLRTSGDGYCFNRYPFFQMLGSREEVEDKLYALALGEEDLA